MPEGGESYSTATLNAIAVLVVSLFSSVVEVDVGFRVLSRSYDRGAE